MNVKTLCLGFLAMREATGYEIKKEFEEGFFSHFIEASYGSIYPALNQLAAQALVTVREEEQAGKPDKKVYAITDAGRAVLSKWIAVVPARDKYKSEFLFEMMLRQYLQPEHVVLAVETQLAHLRTDLENIRHCREKCVDPGMQAGGPDFVLGYGETVLTAAVSYLERKLVELGVPQAPSVAAE
ncbi:PadR family transcriptional regulator [Aestuariivirga sp.]|uniref:PadR family transcriptional regulator n=1 Tax=Aestuariivirga sp. TaxID=2650926 RepID=UPI0039E54832